MSAPTNADNHPLRDWLRVEANDECSTNEAIDQIYSLFAGRTNALAEHFEDDDRHHCFLSFIRTSPDGPHSSPVLFHHLARCPSRIGQPEPATDGKWFFTTGELLGNQHVTVERPSDLFDRVDAVNTYTADRIQRELGNSPEITRLVPVASDENVGDIEALITRAGMWIPHKYAHLCLGDDLSPVDIWKRVYPALLQNGHVDVCKPLVEFLRVQLNGGHESNEAVLDDDDLTYPRPSNTLIRHRNQVLRHLLSPSSSAGTSAGPNVAPQGGIGGMSPSDFQALLAALRGGHAAPAPAPGTVPTTIEDHIAKKWRVNLPSLLKFNLVADPSQLPAVYGALAKGTRKEETTVLQAAYDDLSRSAQAATNAPYTWTKEFSSTIVNLVFYAGDLDRLDEGFHPFRTTYTSIAKSSLDRSHLQTYELLSNDGYMTLDNIQLFKLVLKSEWPTSFLQLDTSLKIFLNVCRVILNPTHPFVVGYSLFLEVWNSAGVQLSLAELFTTNSARPAQFLRSVQLLCAVYWQSIAMLPVAQARIYPAPDFVALLNSFRVQSWVPPSLPGELSPGMGANPSGGGGPSLPGSSMAPGGSTGGPPGSGGSNSGGRSGNTDGDDTSGQGRTRVVNPAPNAQIRAAMSGRRFQLRTVLRDGVRPPQSNGQELCLSYHVRFSCFSDCARNSSHRPLNAQETTTMCRWVNDHVVGPNVGRDQGPAAGGAASAPAPAPAPSS